MAVEVVSGDIFTSSAQALVNPVNCVGIMGAGLALVFKRRFPRNYDFYYQECAGGRVKIGKVLTYPTGMKSPKFIFNFPTKDHWCNRSKTEYIAEGLVSLSTQVQYLNLETVAMPALGCGLGGLIWEDVLLMIHKALDDHSAKFCVFMPR